MERVAQFWYVAMALLALYALGPMAAAQNVPRAGGGSCEIPDIRSDERPTVGGLPTMVSVGMELIDLTDINDVNQTLTGDLLVFSAWTDPRLADLEGCELSLDDIWSPGIAFLNSGRMLTSRPKKADIGIDGSVQYIQRYYGSLATYHDLRQFPFDDQNFRISVQPVEYGEKEVQLVVDEKTTGLRDRLNISDWTINAVNGEIRRRYGDTIDSFISVYDFKISAQRIRTYYVLKVVVPLCLIVFMSWAVFWINPAQFGPQISLSATSMLTLIAFQFATTNMVPKLGYFTVLDWFIAGSTVLVFLALLQSLTTSYLVSQERQQMAERIDYLSRLGFPLGFAALVFIVFFR